MDLDPIAVEFNLVEPAVAGWDLFDVARAGSMKPGNAALMPMAEGFLRWNAIDIPTAWAAVAGYAQHVTPLRNQNR